MKYAALFLWVLVPLGLWAGVTLGGTPHVAWSWRFIDNGDRWNPRAERVYLDCTYLGVTGARRVVAEDGDCPWIRFFKAGAV
ncbi:MAG: hypothetical protein AAFR84_06085 [Pseudomonadota bacterium]